MKRIAIVYQPQLDIGGVETLLFSLFKYIDPQQYSFLVIAPVSADFQSKASAPNVAFAPIPLYKPYELRVRSRLIEILKQENIDLVHAHSPSAAIHARLAAKAAGIPAIVSVQIPALRYYGTRQTLRARAGRELYIQLDRLFNFTLTNRLIFASRHICEESIQRGYAPPERCVVIPNGIDLSPYQPNEPVAALRTRLGLPTDASIITYVGRLVADKGVDILLKALALLDCPAGDDFIACLVGGGPLEMELRAKARQLGLAERVIFCGFQHNVKDYLLASDCFVLPSRNEAMSIAVLEAMAAGLPCVVTDIGDNADLIEHGEQGFIIPQESPESLAAALDQLRCNPHLRQQMGKSARIKAQNFTEVEMARQTQAVYQQVLAVRHSSES